MIQALLPTRVLFLEAIRVLVCSAAQVSNTPESPELSTTL